MIIVILVIGLVILAAGTTLCSIADWDADGIREWAYKHDGFYVGCMIFGAFITIVASMFTISLGYDCSTAKAIHEKIEMYQQENQKIEIVVAETVKNYQDYETQTFSKLAPQEIMVAVSMYPELKSNELVAEQLKIYTANNDKIKELRTKQIDLTTKKWWLYFGN